LLIHAAIWIGLSYQSKLQEARKEKEPIEFVEVAPLPDLVASKAAPKPQGTASKRNSGPSASVPQPKQLTKQLTMSDLGIEWKLGAGGVAMPKRDDNVPRGKNDDYGGDGLYGTNGDLLAAMKGTVSYRFIYELIDHRLYYPEEFGDAGIEGIVESRIVFSKEGKYLKSQSRVKSQSRYLRVFVLRILREVLDQPLPSNYLKGRETNLTVKCLFQFDLRRKQDPFSEDTEAGQSARKQAIGNSLAFYRSAGVFGQWKLGPISGYGIMPAVGVDPGWFLDEIKGATSNKAPIDPLKKYRDDPEW
jgi:hypothetical protein